MEEQRYIVLDVEEPPGRRRRGSPFGQGSSPLAEQPPSASLSVESLTPADASDARRASGRVVAEPLPTRLVQPVANDEVDGPTEPGTAWGIKAVGATESRFSGSGVTVAVLDTGIDAGHEVFAGLEITQRDFTGEGDGDRHGHGTHCAGTIAGRDRQGFRLGVAPGVEELLVAKVLGAEGGSTDALAQGMLWALEAGANVLSMSLGLDFPGLVAQWTQQGLAVQPATSRALEGYRDNLRLFGALASLIRANAAFGRAAVVVAATGNESARGAAAPYTIGVSPPAASEGFIPVAALAPAGGGTLKVADFSNTGAALAAPGVDIVSAKAGGGLASMSGTSMATPHVAGVAALWAESMMGSTDGHLDPAVLITRLIGTSREVASLTTQDGGAGLVRAPLD
jgi:subtilisin family serine protease